MTEQHPITPPPELVRQRWDKTQVGGDFAQEFAAFFARWGADQELEACCEWFQEFYETESWVKHDLKHLRTARRPKPPSLKEQALAELDLLKADATTHGLGFDAPAIRRALESLPD